MINIALTLLGFLIVYLCWAVSVSSWSRLTELGIEHRKSSTTYFDSILSSAFFGTLVSRIVWMFMNMQLYQDVPWGILPYSRSASEFVWFTVFPWRFLRLTEGLYFPILWVVMGLLIVSAIFVPTIKIARKLKLEKRGIMRSFILKNGASALLVLVYFAVLTYFAW